MVKFWNSCISELEDQLTLHKGGGNRLFMTMTMTMTIWWPRSGVWIYQIVTGVTSAVGVPSTHLVFSSTPVLTVSIDVVFILPMNLIGRFMGPTWGPSGADRTQVGPMLAPWTMLSEDMNDVLRKDKSAAREKYRKKNWIWFLKVCHSSILINTWSIYDIHVTLYAYQILTGAWGSQIS